MGRGTRGPLTSDRYDDPEGVLGRVTGRVRHNQGDLVGARDLECEQGHLATEGDGRPAVDDGPLPADDAHVVRGKGAVEGDGHFDGAR